MLQFVMSDGTRIIAIPRADPVDAYSMGGIVKDSRLTVEQFKAPLRIQPLANQLGVIPACIDVGYDADEFLAYERWHHGETHKKKTAR